MIVRAVACLHTRLELSQPRFKGPLSSADRENALFAAGHATAHHKPATSRGTLAGAEQSVQVGTKAKEIRINLAQFRRACKNLLLLNRV